MMTTTHASLENLPTAIWVPAEVANLTDRLPGVYRGSPVEMVQAMAKDNGYSTQRAVIKHYIDVLAQDYKIGIRLPGAASDEDLARLFVYALLDVGVGRPMAQA